ncbi:MAG: DUF5119 domain-containing protein [Muribaculaceae bacterium]|nr:DUF5119 domain-containing protein [Muribaculaceae bacterium]
MKKLRNILGCVLLLTLTACHHKDLYMPGGAVSRLEVVFDWRYAPEADAASMALYMYEQDGTAPLRFIFSNPNGGEIKAPMGCHHLIFLNSDNTYWLKMRGNENVETMEVYTGDAGEMSAQNLESASVPRVRGTEDERLATTPGMLWGGRANDVRITPHTGTSTITLYPREVVCHYTVDVLDVENLDGVGGSVIDATLSGMAEGYSYGKETATDVPVTMTFELEANEAQRQLHGEFLTFGECVRTTVPHYLTVYLIMSDGSRWWYSYDVTDQVSTAPDPRHVHIVVRGLPLPEPPSDGEAGLVPNVNDWQTVTIGLQM